MSSPYVGEIRMFGGSFAPAGWMFCDGQLLPISENETLFNLIGTMYGGDGQETFALPDLQGRTPIHFGQGPGISQNYVQAEKGGVESVTLTVNQIPNHSHPLLASLNVADDPNPAQKMLGESRPGTNSFYQDTAANPMAAAAITPVGGSQPHDNMQPYLVVSYIISLFGLYPSPT